MFGRLESYEKLYSGILIIADFLGTPLKKVLINGNKSYTMKKYEPRWANDTVNDDMRHVYTQRLELSCQALR